MKHNKVLTTIFILFILFIASVAISKTLSNSNISYSNKIALIPISGFIAIGSSDSIFTNTIASSDTIVEFIERADKDTNVKAIVLEINSPGGNVVASKEISQAVKDAEKPVVAWIREIGTSGAYWIASASDYIVSDPLSITGSIGVVLSYLRISASVMFARSFAFSTANFFPPSSSTKPISKASTPK
jgi:protease-4